MSMNPNCDSCCGEDAEHCLCSECMKESAAADQLTERKAIIAWLRRESDRVMMRSVSGIADDIEAGVHLAPPKRSDG